MVDFQTITFNTKAMIATIGIVGSGVWYSATQLMSINYRLERNWEEITKLDGSVQSLSHTEGEIGKIKGDRWNFPMEKQKDREMQRLNPSIKMPDTDLIHDQLNP